MKEGPDISRVATLIGDPARANILTALMTGVALTATELAVEAGVTPQTASGHLAELVDGGLLQVRKQGRHKYFALAHGDVAVALESLMGLASDVRRTRTGPKDIALRRARVCYNHLAGHLGVQMFASLTQRVFLRNDVDAPVLTDTGRAFVTEFGVDLAALDAMRAPLCRSCLDWSERRTHLAGSLGRAMLARMEELHWVQRDNQSRALIFNAQGTTAFEKAFPVG
ncbi:transcriptional regulator [Loktanella sp. D2R18]|uniref:ArsR/SmtB family transcription factor n=1 Tax=Rhodobacterales TaxID=204455 RepID=UPI000DE8EEE8|nr:MULTISPECIES: winged helix-turn-helix domain-containing protein [Rhodobacterales]MDO6589044.1 winged helix-turn-helix domain-containing protein [Yoonia sp. 1_MG-2023]RBW45515.1 transcriptional regulator [Loktanella sp. D2R18]